MTDSTDLQIDQQTESLQDSFIGSLPERLKHIESSWETLLEAENKREQMANFIEAVHYLAGGAGVHGFTSLSQRSQQIIGHLQPCITNNTSLTKETEFMVDHLVSSLYSLKDFYDENGYETSSTQPAGLSDVAGFETERSNDIFILEHNPEEAHALKVFLDNTEHRIHSYKSLHKLHRALDNTIPEAVIIDLQQSQQDATAQEFIAGLQNKSASFPVIALSDTGDFESRLLATRMGATHFFTKPVDGYRLVNTLHKASNIESTIVSKILLVDDDPETSEYIALHLRRQGLEVSTLNDPTKVMDSMMQYHPDLILTDLYMPACNGLELATIIRQHEVYFDTPIVFLTSETDEDSRLAALQLGGDDYFSKSIDIDVVAKAIKSRLKRMSSYALIKKAMVWSPN